MDGWIDGWMDGWMDGWTSKDFTSLSTVFQSFRDHGRVNMKYSVQ